MSLDLRSRRDLYERLATVLEDEEPFDESDGVDESVGVIESGAAQVLQATPEYEASEARLAEIERLLRETGRTMRQQQDEIRRLSGDVARHRSESQRLSGEVRGERYTIQRIAQEVRRIEQEVRRIEQKVRRIEQEVRRIETQQRTDRMEASSENEWTLAISLMLSSSAMLISALVLLLR